MISPDDDETSQEIQRAIDGDRESSANLWENVAQGMFCRETRMFLREVAAKLLLAEGMKAGAARDRAITKAVGLSGVADPHRALLDWVAVMRAFGATRQEMVQRLTEKDAKRGPGAEELERYQKLDPIDLLKLVDRMTGILRAGEKRLADAIANRDKI